MADSSPQAERRQSGASDKLTSLETAFKAQPEKTVVELATAYLRVGRPQDALRVIEKVGADRDVECMVLLAQARFDLFDNDSAAQALRKAGEVGGIDSDKQAQLLLGELAFEKGDTKTASSHLKRVLGMDASNRRAAELLRSLGEDVEVPEGDEDSLYEDINTDDLAGGFADRGSALDAVKHVGIGILVAALATGLYLWQANREHEAAVLVEKARETGVRGSVQSLKEARDLYLQALDSHGGNEMAVAGVAETTVLLFAHHGLDEFRAEAEQYAAETEDDGIERAERYMSKAMLAYYKGDLDDAKQILEEVIEKGAVSEKLFYVLGLVQRSQGELKLGRANLRRAQESEADAPHYAVALGDAYDDDNDSRNATLYWAKAAQANSNYIVGMARDLRSKIRSGKAIDAVQNELKRLTALASGGGSAAVPKPAEAPIEAKAAGEAKAEGAAKAAQPAPSPALTGGVQLTKYELAAIELARSEFLYFMGKTAEAVTTANKAIELGGATPTHLQALGRALLVEGKKKEGLKALNDALEKSFGAERYYWSLLTGYRKAGDFDNALKLLTSQKDKRDDDVKYHVALADVQREKGDFDKALKAYKRALKINEKNPEALLGKGIALWKKRDFDGATKAFEGAVSARSKFPGVYEAIGLMWIEQRATGDGNKQLEHAEKLMLGRGVDIHELRRFYGEVIKGLAANRGTSYLSGWLAKEKASRGG